MYNRRKNSFKLVICLYIGSNYQILLGLYYMSNILIIATQLNCIKVIQFNSVNKSEYKHGKLTQGNN